VQFKLERNKVKTNEPTTTSRPDEQGGDLDREGHLRLERSLKRCATGFKTDLRTPFAKGAERESIIERYETGLGQTSYTELTGIDEHEISKIGPYSIMLPWSERRDSLNEFRTQIYHGNDSILDHVLDEMATLFPHNAFRPMDLDTAVESMPHDTLLGLPTMSSEEQYVPLYLQRAKELKSANEIYPCVAGWRGQPKGLHEVPKQRLVWMFDHAETILGLSILYPVLNRLRVLPGFSAWSSSLVVDEAVTKLLQTARNNGDTIISADYSNFDASVSSTLIDCVFDLLRWWFTEETSSRLDVLEEVFSTVPIVTPDGVFKDRRGGVPSGSALTNLVDTLVNLIAGKYVASRLGVKLISYEVLGDDSVFVFHPTPSVQELSDTFKELGLDSNPDKQFVSKQSAHFLQRWHSLDYQLNSISRGVRSPFRSLNGMLSLERWVDARDGKFRYLMASRLIMQAENSRWDPRFHKFVELMKEDDVVLRSGIDPKEIFMRAGGSDVIRSKLSIASYPFNQQDPDLVEKFATTAVLREIA
jgi:hypothetical protein